MAAAKHGERGRGGAEHRHAFDLGRGIADAPSDRLGFGRSPRPRRRSRRAGRTAASPPRAAPRSRRRRSRRRRRTPSAAITGASGSWVWTSTRPGLSPRPARPATCWICWKLRSAARRSPPGEAEVGIDHADQGQVREVIALGDQLGADDDVDRARLHRARRTRRRLSGRPDRVGGDDRGPRVGEQRRRPRRRCARRPGRRRRGCPPRRIPGRPWAAA